MKYILIAIVVIGLVVAGWFALPDNQGGSSNSSEVSAQNNQQIKQEVEQKTAYLLDVRSPEEYKAGHADMAINHDVELIKAGQMPEIDKNSKIYIYCRSGNRSAQAESLLKNNGYTNLVDLGGLDDIKKIGLL